MSAGLIIIVLATPAAALAIERAVRRWAPEPATSRGVVLLAALAAASFATLWAFAAVPARVAPITTGLGWLLLALAAIDARALILPNLLNAAVVGLGLLAITLIDAGLLADHVIGALVGYGGMAGAAFVYRRVRGREGLGLGDAKFLGAAGAWVGWIGLASVVLIGAVSALMWVVVLAVLRRERPDGGVGLPFGPFLAMGLWLTWLYGPVGVAPPVFWTF